MIELFWGAFEYAVNMVEAIIVIEFLTKYLGKKNGEPLLDYKSIVAVCVFFGTVSLCDIFHANDELSVFLYIGILVVYFCLALDGKLYQKIFVSILDIVMIMIINISIMVLLSTIMNVTVSSIDYSNVSRLLAIIISKLIFFYTTRIILKIRKKDENLVKEADWVFLTLNPFISVCGISALLTLALNFQNNVFNNTIKFAVLCIVITNILNYYLYIRTVINSRNALELRMLNQQVEYQKNHVGEIRLLYNEIRTIRHDMKNHFAYLESLILDGKTETAEEYLNKIKNSINNTPYYVETNNDAVNCILNTKISQAQANGIRIDFHIVDDLSDVEEYDFGVIVGNLLDNAIEACDMVDEDKREISINIEKEQNDNLIIRISNSVKGNIFKSNPNLMTTKKDKKLHGLGVLSCKKIVNKYNGIIKYEENNNIFSCCVMLNFVEKLPDVG